MGPGGVLESCEDGNCGDDRQVMAEREVGTAHYESAKQDAQDLDGEQWVREEADVGVIGWLGFVFAATVLGSGGIRLGRLAFPRLGLCCLLATFLSHNS